MMSRLQPFSFMPSAPASAPAGIRSVGVPSVHSYTRALKNEESAGGPRRKPPVHTCARLTWHSKEVIQFKRHGLSTPHLEVAEDLIANFWLWPDALYNVNDAHAV